MPKDGKPVLLFETNASLDYEDEIEIGYWDEVAELFDLPVSDTVMEWNVDYFFERKNNAYKQAIEEDMSEGEAEEVADEAYNHAEGETYQRWQAGVEGAANAVLANFGLELETKTVSVTTNEQTFPVPTVFIILDSKYKDGWKKAARSIYGTINGLGYSQWESFEDFMSDYDDDDYAEAVRANLSYLKQYPKVWGQSLATTIYNNWSR